MNIDKFLGIVTNRLSFNYIAFQAVTLFCVIFAAVFALLPFGLFFNKDDGVFFLFILEVPCLVLVFLLVTFIEFIYFFCKKQLSQKLFSKSLIFSHMLFTYVLCLILMFICPNSEELRGIEYLIVFAVIVLHHAVKAFTVIPVVLGVILELLKDIDIPPMQYMKNIWGFWGTISATLIYIYLIVRFFLFSAGK